MLTIEQKHEIIIRYNMNISTRKIADDMMINQRTVILWINKYKNKEELIIKKGRGRKNKLTNEQELIIVDLMYKNKFWKIPELKLELAKIKINVSENTLINILKKHNFNYEHRKIKTIFIYFP